MNDEKDSIRKYELEEKYLPLHPETVFIGKLIDKKDPLYGVEFVFSEIGRGLSKIVLVLESPIEESLKKKNSVYCIALHGMKKSLLFDIKIRSDIQQRLKTIGVNVEESFLDIEFKQSDYIINDKETFEFERADINLKSQLENSLHPLTFLQNLDVIVQIITGVNFLHKTGYVHGDLKLDNVFLYFNHLNKYSRSLQTLLV